MQPDNDSMEGEALFVSQRLTTSASTEPAPTPEPPDIADAAASDEASVDIAVEQPASIEDADEGTAALLGDLDHRVQKLNDRFEQMEFTFAETTASIEALRTDISNLSSQLQDTNMDRFSDDISVIRDTVAAQQEAILGVSSHVQNAQAAPIEPEDDGLDDLKHQFSKQSDEIKTEVADQIASLAETLTQNISEMRAELAALNVQPEPPPIEPLLDNFWQQIDQRLTATESDFSKGLETLNNRPDPVLDLGPQRRSFAQFAAILGKVTERLEAVGERYDEQREAISSNDTNFSDKLSEVVASLEARLDKLAQSHDALVETQQNTQDTELLEQVLNAVTMLAKRPDPVLDLTAQRRGFATFNAAAGTFLRRLECLVATMASEHVRANENAAKTEPDAPASDEPMSDTPVSDAPFEDSTSLVGAISRLAEANAVLAGKSYSRADEIASQQEEFLRDLRFAVAEALAQGSNDAPATAKNVSSQ